MDLVEVDGDGRALATEAGLELGLVDFGLGGHIDTEVANETAETVAGDIEACEAWYLPVLGELPCPW